MCATLSTKERRSNGDQEKFRLSHGLSPSPLHDRGDHVGRAGGHPSAAGSSDQTLLDNDKHFEVNDVTADLGCIQIDCWWLTRRFLMMWWRSSKSALSAGVGATIGGTGRTTIERIVTSGMFYINRTCHTVVGVRWGCPSWARPPIRMYMETLTAASSSG